MKEFLKSRPVRILFKAALLFVVLILLFYLSILFGFFGSIPSISELRKIQNYTASEIYSADGVLLGKYFIQERTNVAFDEISPNVVNALIATEDVRFYKHSGIDRVGLVRVFVKSLILQDESSGGGSTLSQQLAKNLYPRGKYSFLTMPVNKVKEAITARKLEGIFNKQEILAFYLNTVSFGENAFGIHTAAQRYFNTAPAKLKPEDAALLIGMLKAPTSYNPKKFLEKSMRRRNVVLSQMAKYEYLSKETADSLSKLPVKLKFRMITHNDGLATYFRENLRVELQKWCGEHTKPDGSPYNLYTDGLKIYTTIDSKMQEYAEQAVREHMSQLQGIFYAHWKGALPWGKNTAVIRDAKLRSSRYRQLKEEGFSSKEIDQEFKKPRKIKVFSWKGEKIKTMSPLDSIKYYQYFLHAGFMAMSPRTGYVQAWVGDIDHNYFKYDHVNINTKRQVGSTFKPIVYATAIESGMNPCDYIPNERKIYPEYDNWSPRNSNDQYGGMYSMQGGLTSSVNTISANIMIRTGAQKVVSTAKKMGISSNLKPVPSMALGTADISLYEMVGAYSTFPNRGLYKAPVYLLRIEDNHGMEILKYEEPQNKKRVLSGETADMMVHIMKNVVNEGTASRIRTQYGLSNEIAGKTGTTQSQSDGWFIGFTPDIVAGIWVGAEDRRVHFRSTELGQGANTALPIWALFMNKVYRDKSYKDSRNKRFPELSLYAAGKLNCEDFIAAASSDTLNFFERLFGKKKKEEIKDEKKKKDDEKYHKTFSKIRNMFRRKKY